MIYRVGLIGLDGHTNYSLDPLPNLKNVQLVAIASENQKHINDIKKFKAYTPNVKLYRDYREMLKKESLDIACIYTPNSQHAEAIIAAVESGSHIFSEKPLATTLSDLEKVKNAVQKSGKLLSMMLNMRSDGHYLKIREIVQSGTLGVITQCSAQKSYKVGDRNDWEKKRVTLGGIIPYIACHALDLIRWCSGLEFVKGAAFHNNIGRPDLGEMENSASMICLADNGATIATRLDYCRPEIAPTWGDDRLRIAGTQGIVELLFGEISLITAKQKSTIISPSPSVVQFKNFIEALEKREPLLVPTDDCYRITEVVLKLRDAADSQTVVAL